MEQTDRHYKIVAEFARLFPEKDDFVILKETKKGTRYIEWAFRKGRPHDFTCLSWYLKPHPKYIKKYPNTYLKTLEVGEIFHLTKFTCDLDKKKAREERCEVGSPKPMCSYIGGKKWREWDYTEPVKCACWDSISITKKEIQTYYKEVARWQTTAMMKMYSAMYLRLRNQFLQKMAAESTN